MEQKKFLIKVNSSTVSHIAFYNGVMYARFSTGTIYAYSVSKEEYDSIFESDSVGSKLKEVVKGKAYRKLTKEELNLFEY